nr:MAG TPA: hypothetical protein [Caudoviricetes sp.]
MRSRVAPPDFFAPFLFSSKSFSCHFAFGVFWGIVVPSNPWESSKVTEKCDLFKIVTLLVGVFVCFRPTSCTPRARRRTLETGRRRADLAGMPHFSHVFCTV